VCQNAKLILYRIQNAEAYIIDKYNTITKVNTHIMGIIDLYNLENDILSTFKTQFGEQLDWDKDWDDVVEFVKDFMQTENIFNVIVDIENKQVYVRPRLSETPSYKQMKELSDWAIEHNWNEEIIIDVVAAFNNLKWYKIAHDRLKN